MTGDRWDRVRAPGTGVALAALLWLLICAASGYGATPKKPARPAPRAAPAPPLKLPPADDAQLSAAALAYSGEYRCEFQQTLRVKQNTQFEGYVDVQQGTQNYVMKPVLSSTGALRLEDVRGQTLLVQIGSKSMLLDVRAGHRLVDDCVSEQQAENRRVLAAAPPQPGLFDPPTPATTGEAVVVAAAAAELVATAASSSPDAAASAAVAVTASVVAIAGLRDGVPTPAAAVPAAAAPDVPAVAPPAAPPAPALAASSVLADRL